MIDLAGWFCKAMTRFRQPSHRIQLCRIVASEQTWESAALLSWAPQRGRHEDYKCDQKEGTGFLNLDADSHLFLWLERPRKEHRNTRVLSGKTAVE